MNIYVGTFLIAFATLTLEITLSRFLSVSTWYHLAFFAISTAMLGMTAGATTVYLKGKSIGRRGLAESIALACTGFAVSLPVVLLLLCLIPIRMERSVMPIFSLAIVTVLCTLPFYFSGIALSIILTKFDLPIGRIYAVDLIGAALGCLFVLGGLELLSAPSLLLVCALIGAIAAPVFAIRSTGFQYRKLNAAVGAICSLLVILNATTSAGIYQMSAKGRVLSVEQVMIERWNSHSRVVVYKELEERPLYWGPSPAMPAGEIAFQYPMNIDGDAFTSVRKFASTSDIENLRYDITNLAYYLRPTGGSAFIGVGGGRDLQSALLFGHELVVVIDVNPIFINLQNNEFRDFAGLGNNPKVRLVTDEARSYLTRSDENFSVLQMSMIDTWASTGAGAFSLSENGLYTVEAWDVFFRRLNPDGIFTVSRWFNPAHSGETGRILSVTVAALLRNGVADPSKHIALVAVDKVATLLLSKEPLTSADLARLRSVSADLQYKILAAPDTQADDQILREIIAAKSGEALQSAIKDSVLNYQPSTDESPYFFNMLRLGHLDYAFRSQTGVSTGNLLATITLVALIVSLGLLAVVTIVVPLRMGTKSGSNDEGSRRAMRFGALYFCLIGAGFMFAEIAMIQKLSVFLGHPVYALGILLFTIIASTGIGSFLNDLFRPNRSAVLIGIPLLTAVMVIVQKLILSMMLADAIAMPIAMKAAMCVAAIFPLGILFGFFFPTGMKVFRPLVNDDAPWFWALNGIFGVLSSAIAVFVSIYFGISTNFYLAAICYAATAYALIQVRKKAVIR